MADYYVDTSQTFNGDGTVSTGAASDGAAGAANSFIEVMKGLHSTIGSLADGSNVYVRTHDGANDCNETITVDTDFATSATEASPIDIYFDDGTVWTGDSGQYTIINATDSADLQISSYLNLHGGDSSDRRFKYDVSHTSTNSNAYHLNIKNSVTISGFEYDSSSALSPSKIYVIGHSIVINDLLYKYNSTKQFYAGGYPTVGFGSAVSVVLRNPIFNVPSATTEVSGCGIFNPSIGFGGFINITGGKIIGGRSTVALIKNTIYANGNDTQDVTVTGFDLGTGGSVLFYEADYETRTITQRYQVRGIGLGGGLTFKAVFQGCIVKFDDNGSYPTLNSLLPSSTNTKWSYLAKLHTTVGGNYIACLPPINKYYTDTSGTKVITAHLLVDSTHSPTKNNFWAEIGYTNDTTGEYTVETTRIDAATVLDSDTAQWSLGSYPGFSGVKRKITLSANIRQNTPVKCSLFTNMSNPSTTTVMFFDPDIEFI